MEKAKIYQIIQDKKEVYFVNIGLVTISVRKYLISLVPKPALFIYTVQLASKVELVYLFKSHSVKSGKFIGYEDHC